MRRRQPSDVCSRCVFFTVVVFGLWLSTPALGAPAAEMDIILAAEIRDLTDWLAFHQEVVSTPPESGKPLLLSLPGDTGGDRWLRVDSPKFLVKIDTADGSRLVKLTITGKLFGAAAQRDLIAFERAAFLVQTGAVANQLSIVYGLTEVAGRLIEIQAFRP